MIPDTTTKMTIRQQTGYRAAPILPVSLTLPFGKVRLATPGAVGKPRVAGSSGSGGGARQNDASDEAGSGILQREPAAMQMTDGRHDGQPEAVTGKAPAPIETVEPRDYLRSLFGWDARALVRNDDRHGLPIFARSDSHGRGAAAVLEGVVQQIGRRACEERLVTERRRLAHHIDDERDAVGLGGGIVELHNLRENVLEGDRLEALAARLRLRLPDFKELVRGDDQLVTTLHSGGGRTKRLRGRPGPQHLVEAASNPAERRSEIVGDGV